MDLWKIYRVRLDFLTNLCGSVPGDSELIKKWLDNRTPTHRPPGGRSIDEIQEEVLATLTEPVEEAEPSYLMFQRNPGNGGNLVLRTATLRAHMKDCSRVISGHSAKIQGEKSFATKVKNFVYHDEKDYWTPILRPDGSLIYEADGRREKAIHVPSPRGQMNALKMFEIVYPARVDFTLKVFCLGDKEAVPLKDLSTLFVYGGVHGYGGERSDGEGRYSFEIDEVTEEKVSEPKGTRVVPAHDVN